jgi:hypothetical protein
MIKMEEPKINYGITDISDTPVVRTKIKIHATDIISGEDGWIWLQEDYYCFIGNDIYIYGFGEITISLKCDKELSEQLPQVNPPEIVLP